jgi:hypothetical protein
VAPEGLLVLGVVEALWLLEEQALNPSATVRTPAIQGDLRRLVDLAGFIWDRGAWLAILCSCLMGLFLPGKAVISEISSGYFSTRHIGYRAAR